MVNKYGGKCHKCGEWVEAEKGLRVIVGGYYNPRSRRTEGGTWVNEHSRTSDCESAKVARAEWVAQREASAPPEHIAVRNALRIVAGLDPDRAGLLNGVGFSGRDTDFGHKMAGLSSYSPKQYEVCLKLAWKYRRQLPPEVLNALPPRPERAEAPAPEAMAS